MNNKNCCLGIFFCSLVLLFFSNASVAKPSLEDFVKFEQVNKCKLSPSGKYLALTRRIGDSQGLLVINLDTMRVASGTYFGKNEDVWDFNWANDERLLIEPALRTPASMSYKAPTGELIGMNADGTNLRLLAGFRKKTSRTGTFIHHRSRITSPTKIFDAYRQDQDHVLVQTESQRLRGGYSRAYLMNINNGSAKVVGRSKTRFGSFVADSDGIPAINFGLNAFNETEIYYRDGSDQSFELLLSSEFGKSSVVPVAALPSGDGYYVLESVTGDTRALSIWRPEKPNELELQFRHDSVDINSIITSPNNAQIIAIKYLDPLPNYYYPDPSLSIVQEHKRLRHENPGRDVVIESITSGLDKAVINVTGDIHPSTYYLLDVASGKTNRIFQTRPDLPREHLTRMQPVSVPTRDGLELRGFLTQPNAQTDNQSKPLILLVHGGPYGIQDQWGYDFEVQLLASRGYSVLQVNYRGSFGAGLAFQSAGIGQWGAKMQDDLTDATHWAIQQGYADPERICIYGSSYGGYAALIGAAREPNLYRCAIGYGGVYDLENLFSRGAIQTFASGESYLSQVLGRDRDELRQRSPYFQAEEIKAKVFIAHGRKDNIAPYRQAKNMRKALREAGNDPEYFVESKEGHGFFGQQSRIRYYTKLLAFLDENIGEQSIQ